MKILITSESYYPNVSGVAVFVHYLAQNLVKRGHQVFIITPGDKKQPKYKKEIKNGVIIYRLKSVYNPFRKGYRFTLFPYVSVKKIINEINPDVIHMQDPSPICISALFICRHKIPIIITNHFSLDYILSYIKLPKPFDQYLAEIFSRYLHWFYKYAAILTCPTPTVAKYLKAKNIHADAVAISNGVNLEQFFPYYGDMENFKTKYNIPPNKKMILHVGRFDKDKRIEVLIKAIPIVLKEKNVCFVLCGDGKEKEKYIQMIKNLKLEKNVVWVGVISHQKELPKMYQVADLFVTPSPIETQGIVALEAMASAKPIVGANAGALPELIKNNINGLTFKPGDEKDFAEKILKILKNDKMSLAMGERGLELVEKHSLEKTYNKFEEIYEKAVAKN